MKKLSLSLAFAAAMALPVSAMALDVNQAYTVSIFNGAQEVQAGTVYFSLVSSSPQECTYYYEWEHPNQLISVDCLVAEQKVLGHRACLTNANKSFDTVIVKSNLNAADQCRGFDRFQLERQVLFLALGESQDSQLHGIIVMDGPASDIQSIEMIGS